VRTGFLEAAVRWAYRPRIRVRLAFSSVLVLVLLLVFVGYALASGLRSGLRERAHESLETPFRVIELQLARDPGVHLADIFAVSPAGEPQDEVIGQRLGADGAVVDSTGQPAVLRPVVGRAELDAALRDGEWHEARHLAGREEDDIVVVVPVSSGSGTGDFVVLAQSLASADAEVGSLLRLYALLAPLLLAAAVAGGWWIAGAALRPVDALTRRAAAIDPDVSDATLPVPPGNDEVTRLAVALNDMLARLRNALERQRQFSADASHELRSPLAVMMATLDVHLRSPDLPDEMRPLLRSLREDATRLTRVVEDLLVLSRSEAGGAVDLHTADADLLDIAVGVAGRYRTPAESRDITISVSGAPVVVRVDAQLLGQAVANLVDNAVKFGRPGGRIEIRVMDDTVPALVVSDDGPGIPPKDLPHVFERFYRADPARRVGGSGLGLAIVRAIVAAHSGTVDVSSTPGNGTRFTIRLPRHGDDGTPRRESRRGSLSSPRAGS